MLVDLQNLVLVTYIQMCISKDRRITDIRQMLIYTDRRTTEIRQLYMSRARLYASGSSEPRLGYIMDNRHTDGHNGQTKLDGRNSRLKIEIRQMCRSTDRLRTVLRQMCISTNRQTTEIKQICRSTYRQTDKIYKTDVHFTDRQKIEIRQIRFSTDRRTIYIRQMCISTNRQTTDIRQMCIFTDRRQTYIRRMCNFYRQTKKNRDKTDVHFYRQADRQTTEIRHIYRSTIYIQTDGQQR